jgi:hypothetical protein
MLKIVVTLAQAGANVLESYYVGLFGADTLAGAGTMRTSCRQALRAYLDCRTRKSISWAREILR